MTTSSPPGAPPAEAVPPEDPPRRKFHLLRYFSIASGIAVLVVTLVLSWAYYVKEVNAQVESTEARNTTLALTFANTIRPGYDAYLFQDWKSARHPPVDPRRQELHDLLKRISLGIPVIKMKIYNFDGRAIYSTERDEFGEDRSRNPLFRLARNGKTVSQLTRRGQISESDGKAAAVDLVSTYIPIIGTDGRVAAVFELYSDVTDAVLRVEHASLRLLAGLVVIFASFYGILLLIVGRADRILHRQYRDLKSIENQVSATNRELQVEIAVRQQVETALRESEKAAAKANQAKTEFLSSISHELRTPLHGILGFAQLLSSEPTLPLTTAQRSFLDQILKAGRHLLQLINQILDLASIEAGRIRLSVESVNVATVVAECLPLIQAMAVKKDVTIAVPPVSGSLRVLADYMRLKQSLLNLLSNAVKYNRPGGKVSVDVRAVADRRSISRAVKYNRRRANVSAEVRPADKQRIRISVEDTGPGIPESMLGDLFRPFHRLESSAQNVEGTGIGLALTRSLVNAMDGDVGVSSVLQLGSTFWMELPAAPEAAIGAVGAAASRAEAPSGEVKGKERCLLYVEDNPANVLLMQEIARRMSLRFISASDAETGIPLAASEQPDLIVMDINLPGMNGYEALVRLRENSATAAIPVMALSANAMDKDVVRGMEAGFVRYETKPYEVEDMVRRIGQLLDGRA